MWALTINKLVQVFKFYILNCLLELSDQCNMNQADLFPVLLSKKDAQCIGSLENEPVGHYLKLVMLFKNPVLTSSAHGFQ